MTMRMSFLTRVRLCPKILSTSRLLRTERRLLRSLLNHPSRSSLPRTTCHNKSNHQHLNSRSCHNNHLTRNNKGMHLRATTHCHKAILLKGILRSNTILSHLKDTYHNNRNNHNHRILYHKHSTGLPYPLPHRLQ